MNESFIVLKLCIMFLRNLNFNWLIYLFYAKHWMQSFESVSEIVDAWYGYIWGVLEVKGILKVWFLQHMYAYYLRCPRLEKNMNQIFFYNTGRQRFCLYRSSWILDIFYINILLMCSKNNSFKLYKESSKICSSESGYY